MMLFVMCAAVGFVCTTAGFLAGVRYAGRVLPRSLAQFTDDEMRALLRVTSQLRKARR